MEKLDLENKVLKFGKVSFNSSALVGLTKAEFKERYASALLGSTDDVWKQIQKYTKTKSKPKKTEKGS